MTDHTDDTDNIVKVVLTADEVDLSLSVADRVLQYCSEKPPYLPVKILMAALFRAITVVGKPEHYEDIVAEISINLDEFLLDFKKLKKVGVS